MIQLEQIPASDKLGNLRNRINTMANEINTNQMVIGQVMNPSIVYKDSSGNQVGASTASLVTSYLYCICMPESNGVYIANIFGALSCTKGTFTAGSQPAKAVIDIPGIKLPNRDSVISTFVTPEHLGFTPYEPNTHIIYVNPETFAINVTSNGVHVTTSANYPVFVKQTENHAEASFYITSGNAQ